MQFAVSGQRLTIQQPTETVAPEDFCNAEFIFDSTWRYSSVWANLEGNGIAYRMKVENGSITTDNVTALPEGRWDVYLKGENYNENGTLREEKITNLCHFTVTETEEGQRCRFRTVATPTPKEQTKFLALQALDLAKRVMHMALADDFKGDPGGIGPRGETGATGPQGPAGSDASVTAENIASALGYTPYSKPTDGIPKTDLASAVQTSLGKADASLRRPVILTVKTDGTGDYSSIRAAVESITDSGEEKPYIVEVYPGTYNVADYFTPEEILSGEYTGIMIHNYVTLRGVGAARDQIILHGELSTSDYTKQQRNVFSTLNIGNNGTLENLTITAKNIRYCVHDDFARIGFAVVRNCAFSASTMTSGSPAHTYGAGDRAGSMTIFEDCDFGTKYAWHTHNSPIQSKVSTIIFKNCTADTVAFWDYHANNIKTDVQMYNCFFDHISVSTAAESGADMNIRLSGVGTKFNSISNLEGFIYDLPDHIPVPTNVSAFTNDAGYLTSHQSLTAYRTAAAQDTIDDAQNTAISGKEAKGKITISGVEKTANTHTVTIVTNGVTTTMTLVGVS